jgi:hypothetical protein
LAIGKFTNFVRVLKAVWSLNFQGDLIQTLNWMGGERQKGNLRLGTLYSGKAQRIGKLSPATVKSSICCPAQVQPKTSHPQKERLTTQQATAATVESINRGGDRSQRATVPSTFHNNTKQQPNANKPKKTPKKTLSLRSLPRKTQNKP